MGRALAVPLGTDNQSNAVATSLLNLAEKEHPKSNEPGYQKELVVHVTTRKQWGQGAEGEP